MTAVREEVSEYVRVPVIHRTVFEEAQLDPLVAERAAHHQSQFEGIRHDDEVTLHLQGDVTTQSAPFLRGLLHAVMELQPQRIVVDLTDVGIVGRDQLRTFCDCAREIGDLVFRNPSAATRATLENVVSIGQLWRKRQRLIDEPVPISDPSTLEGQ